MTPPRSDTAGTRDAGRADDTTVSPQEVKRMLDARANVTLLDVREPDEFSEWHIPGAVNVPLAQLESGAEPPRGRAQPVITVCLHGMRSERARKALTARGYNARTMTGGMVAWNRVYDIAEVPLAAHLHDVKVLQIRRVGKGCLSYVIVSEEEAVVIDPTLDAEVYLEAAREHEASIVGVIDTHAHADHASGGPRLAQAAGAPYLAPDEHEFTRPHETLGDGDEFTFGNTKLQAMATPGHTPGSLTLLFATDAFTGDTVLVDGVGRPDLGENLRENAAILYDTLTTRLLTLPPDTRILPAHHGETHQPAPGEPVQATVAQVRDRLPVLDMTRDEFVNYMETNRPPAPPNFARIKRHNLGVEPVEDEDELRDLEAGPNRCAVSA